MPMKLWMNSAELVMSKILTFNDSGVILAGWRSDSRLRIRALTILSDAEREFVSSPFVSLELKPKAVYHKNSLEVEFYDAYFENVTFWVDDVEKIVSLAESVSEKYGLNGMDALHIAAAIIAEADEFITTERATSPLNRVTEVQIISIK